MTVKLAAEYPTSVAVETIFAGRESILTTVFLQLQCRQFD
jgi:hypothetical protein